MEGPLGIRGAEAKRGGLGYKKKEKTEDSFHHVAINARDGATAEYVNYIYQKCLLCGSDRRPLLCRGWFRAHP